MVAKAIKEEMRMRMQQLANQQQDEERKRQQSVAGHDDLQMGVERGPDNSLVPSSTLMNGNHEPMEVDKNANLVRADLRHYLSFFFLIVGPTSDKAFFLHLL